MTNWKRHLPFERDPLCDDVEPAGPQLADVIAQLRIAANRGSGSRVSKYGGGSEREMSLSLY